MALDGIARLAAIAGEPEHLDHVDQLRVRLASQRVVVEDQVRAVTVHELDHLQSQSCDSISHPRGSVAPSRRRPSCRADGPR